MPGLDLTDYEVPAEGFEPLKRGWYFANIYAIEEREIGDRSKMPEGTPMIWVHFQITGRVGEDVGPNEDNKAVYNRRAFINMPVPPEDYDDKARRLMNGRLVSFFKAVGFSDEDLASKDFNYGDLDDLEDKELLVLLGTQKDKRPPEAGGTGELQQTINGFRRADDVPTVTTTAESSGGIL